MRVTSARLSMLFANVGHTMTHLLMLLYPTVVLTLEARTGLGYGALMWLAVPGTVLYGVAALPAGWLGDRWSAERMMVLFFLGSGLACLVTGLAHGPMGILFGLALIGLFGAIYHPVGTAWLVRNAVNRGRMLGWNGIFGQLGIGIAPFTAAALTQALGWRAAFLVPGALCLGLGVVLALLVRSGRVVAAAADRRPVAEPASRDVRRAFLMLSITMLAAGIVFQAMTTVLPKLFEERLAAYTHGGTLGTGTLVSVVFIVSSAFPMLGGWLADRTSMKWIYVLAWAAQIPVLFAATRLFGLPLFAAAMALFCLTAIAIPTENSLLARYTPSRWRATAYGAKFVLSLGVSALGIPLVAVVYERTHDFVWLFAILGVLAATVVGAGLFLPQDRPERAPLAQPAE